MPWRRITLKPGVTTQYTMTLAESTWSQSNLIRFKDGLPHKLGGWQHLNATPLVGTGRGMHVWADLMGIARAAVGTEQRLQLFDQGAIEDITPLRTTTNPDVDFSTQSTMTAVNIEDDSHGAAVGDWVYVNVPVSVGGLIIQGFYQIQTVVDPDNYKITAANPATSTVNHGGAVPSFNTSGAGVHVVTVTLNNHGLSNGAFFAVQVATTVGGIVIGVGSYVISAATTNTFQITPGGAAAGAATVSENSGNTQIWYLIPTGLASNMAVQGYGTGTYGGGTYGQGSGGTILELLRQWFLDNWGQDLIGNYTGSPILVWVPNFAAGNVAIFINTTNFPSATSPPQKVNSSFVAMPSQIMVALGCDPVGGGTQDPNLVRWSDVADFTDWVATTANQAGSFRIPSGSLIVGGLQAPQYGLIWTDVDMWLMQYIGAPFIFGFTKVAFGVDLIAARAAGLYQSLVFWMSSNNFFVYDGTTTKVLPCTVWHAVFINLNRNQKQKVFCAVNSWFGEVFWFYPSLNATEVDSYVKYNILENVWDYGLLPRTCWSDDSPLGSPIGTDTSGLLQQHEVGNDADGAPMGESITSGWFNLADGSFFTFIERVMPDFQMEGPNPNTQTVTYSILVSNYPPDSVVTFGPYTWGVGPGPDYQIVRARGRVAALQINGSGLNTRWKLGAFRMLMAPAGRGEV